MTFEICICLQSLVSLLLYVTKDRDGFGFEKLETQPRLVQIGRFCRYRFRADRIEVSMAVRDSILLGQAPHTLTDCHDQLVRSPSLDA